MSEKTRGESEYERWRKCAKDTGDGRDAYVTLWSNTSREFHAAWEAYAASLPPRPIQKTPGQQLRDILCRHNLPYSKAPWDKMPQFSQKNYEAAAAELGIPPQEQ